MDRKGKRLVPCRHEVVAGSGWTRVESEMVLYVTERSEEQGIFGRQ